MFKNNYKLKRTLLFLSSILIGFSSFSATVTWDGTDDADGDGFAWSNPLNWDTDAIPGPGDDVIIPAGAGDFGAVYADITTTISSLTIQSTAGTVCSGPPLFIGCPPTPAVPTTLYVGFTGAYDIKLTVTNDLSFTNGEVTLIIQESELEVQGNVTGSYDVITVEEDETFDINGNLTATGSTFTLDGILETGGSITGISVGNTSTVVFDGASAQNIPNYTYQNLELDGNGMKTIATNLTINGTTTLSNTPNVDFSSASTQTILPGAYGDLTFSGGGEKQISGTVSSSGTFTPGTGVVTYNGTSQSVMTGSYGTLQLNGSGTHTIGGDLSATSFSNSTSTVHYNGASTQTILAGTYTALTFSNTGQKNIAGTVTVSGTLTSGTSTNVNVTGSVSAGTFVAGTSTYDFSNNGAQGVPSLAFYNLTVSGTGNKTLSDNLMVSNNLTTSGTATLAAGANNVTVTGIFTNDATTTGSGNLTLNGTYDNDGTLTLDDAGSLILGGNSFTGTSSITVNNLQIGLNGTYTLNNGVTVKSGGTLTLTNGTTTLNANGNLTLDANNSGFARVAAIPSGSSITNDVIAKAYVDASIRAWWHLSNPVVSAPASQWINDVIVTGDFTGNSNDLITGFDQQSMFSYNEASTSTGIDDKWADFPDANSTETMAFGTGYRIYIRDNSTTVTPKTLEVTGTLNQGNVVIPISYTDNSDVEADGWNFIGNPYASSIDWTNVTKAGTDGIAYVWDATNKSYSFSTDITIAPFQGFWVQSTTGANITVTESDKTTGGTLQRPTTLENEIKITLLDENEDEAYNHAETSIFINSDATTDADYGLDAAFLSRNMFNEIDNSPSVDIATRLDNGKRLKTNNLPESNEIQEIELFTEYSDADTFTLHISLNNYNYGQDIILLDSYTNEQEILVDGEIIKQVVLTDELSRASDRFSIQVGANPVGLNDDHLGGKISIFPNPTTGDNFSIKMSEVYSNVSISIVDLSGNIVYNEEVNNSNSSFSKSISTESLEAGIYFVKVVSNGASYSEKLILNK